MIICNSNNHDSIVYKANIDCPLCKAVKKINELENELKDKPKPGLKL